MTSEIQRVSYQPRVINSGLLFQLDENFAEVLGCCVFSSVRSGVADIALLLGYDGTSLCIRLQQFPDSVSYIFRPLRTRTLRCIETSGTDYQVPRYHMPEET